MCKCASRCRMSWSTFVAGKGLRAKTVKTLFTLSLSLIVLIQLDCACPAATAWPWASIRHGLSGVPELLHSWLSAVRSRISALGCTAGSVTCRLRWTALDHYHQHKQHSSVRKAISLVVPSGFKVHLEQIFKMLFCQNIRNWSFVLIKMR